MLVLILFHSSYFVLLFLEPTLGSGVVNLCPLKKSEIFVFIVISNRAACPCACKTPNYLRNSNLSEKQQPVTARMKHKMAYCSIMVKWSELQKMCLFVKYGGWARVFPAMNKTLPFQHKFKSSLFHVGLESIRWIVFFLKILCIFSSSWHQLQRHPKSGIRHGIAGTC